MGAKDVISLREHSDLRGSLRVDISDDDEKHTHEYATVPTKAYANSAPRGPAPRNAEPDPRNNPVPIVPAICTA
jgi:hypothetical protein